MFSMVFWILVLTMAGIGLLRLWVETVTPLSPRTSGKRGQFDPCPVTGLQACPWHPDGGEHPDVAS